MTEETNWKTTPNPKENSILDIEAILKLAENNSAISDIHMAWDEAIAFRINGDIKRYEEAWKLNSEAIEIILRQLMKGNPKSFDKFMGDKDSDFSFMAKNGTTYRVNAYLKLGKIGIVMRKINDEAKKLEEIMFSDIAESIKQNILSLKKGLYLVTGPTGSWKSTSIVSMLDYINETRQENIITIEDPIEFIFKAKQSLFSQREVGHDTRSFSNALRAAMREDPNIIFVWEIRDRETAESVLNLSETGHLVFSTLHTSSAASTASRFISFFPPEIQDSIADRLADALIWIQSQFLTKTSDQSKRLALFELLINTTAIKNTIRKKDFNQIDSIIFTGESYGMITLGQYAKRLIEKWIITEESVARVFNQKK